MTTPDGLFKELKRKYPSIPINLSWVGNLALSSSGSQLTAEEIFKTWLTTDITKTDPLPQLSNEDLEQMRINLNKTLTLQIISIINVGSSMYSQLKKLSGKELPSDQNTSYTFREPAPTRLLFLEVTDGVNYLSAMEYLPCPRLSTAILPGTKFQVFDPTIRQEVILLTPDNFKILGGCVEELRLQNTQERLLRSYLDEDYLPGDDNGGGDIIRNDDPSRTPTSEINGQSSSSNQQLTRISGAPTAAEHNGHSNISINDTTNSPSIDDKDTRLDRIGTYSNGSHISQHNENKVVKDTSPIYELDNFDTFATDLFDIDESGRSDEFLNISSLTLNVGLPVKIKGLVSTLCSKLQASPEWTLDLRISDPTGNIESRFSENVLVSLIGFTSAEFKKLQPKSKTDPSLKEHLKKGLESCQSQLRFMTGIFTIDKNSFVSSKLPYEVVEYEKLPLEEERALKATVFSRLNISPDVV